MATLTSAIGTEGVAVAGSVGVNVGTFVGVNVGTSVGGNVGEGNSVGGKVGSMGVKLGRTSVGSIVSTIPGMAVIVSATMVLICSC